LVAADREHRHACLDQFQRAAAADPAAGPGDDRHCPCLLSGPAHALLSCPSCCTGAHSCARIRCLSTLPVSFLGSASHSATASGNLKVATPRAARKLASEATSGVAP